MKQINKIVKYLPLLLLAMACDEQSTNSNSEESVNRPPIALSSDSLINELRLFEYKPTIVVDLSADELEEVAASILIDDGSTPPLYDPDLPPSMFSSVKYVIKRKLFVSTEEVPGYSALGTQSFQGVGFNQIVVGLAAESQSSNFRRSGVYAREIKPNFDLKVPSPVYRQNSSGSMDIYGTHSSAGALQNGKYRVLIGVGLNHENGSLKSMWTFYGPYNPATGKIEVTSPGDIDVIAFQHGLFGFYWELDVILRTFDYVDYAPTLEKTFVLGFGASVQDANNIERIGLQLGTLK